ncbi:MAG TPA: sigma-70 family RNA polymerase sigma factor [Verrucomicrobiae bacterium]|nr:sigma-70 family RNA polymerase sigma factor [Verrucomicrobiae bacterium]
MVFATTQWTQVLQARGDSPEAKAALSELCDFYYAPVFAFIRHNSFNEEAARELTQEFFSRLLSGKGIRAVDPERGRFRSFLLGAVKHFLSDMRDHDRRVKRGEGRTPLPLETRIVDAHTISPDREFDRKWAFTVLDRSLARLAEEKPEHLDILKPWLTGDSKDLSQADAAKQLGMSEGAVKVAVYRLRKRFRELVKAEIAQTLNDPAQVGDELAALIDAIR